MAPSRRDQEFESPFLQGESAANPISAGQGHRLDARAHEARGLTAPDGRAGRIRHRARRLLLKARDDAAARLR